MSIISFYNNDENKGQLDLSFHLYKYKRLPLIKRDSTIEEEQ
ncbi:hypothetical protein [Heyndrickxia ginsengihumi]